MTETPLVMAGVRTTRISEAEHEAYKRHAELVLALGYSLDAYGRGVSAVLNVEPPVGMEH